MTEIFDPWSGAAAAVRVCVVAGAGDRRDMSVLLRQKFVATGAENKYRGNSCQSLGESVTKATVCEAIPCNFDYLEFRSRIPPRKPRRPSAPAVGERVRRQLANSMGGVPNRQRVAGRPIGNLNVVSGVKATRPDGKAPSRSPKEAAAPEPLVLADAES